MKCVFCKKTQGLFSLTVKGDEEVYTQHVCGECWEAVAEIAYRRIKSEIENLTARIEELEAHEVSPYEAAMIVERSKAK